MQNQSMVASNATSIMPLGNQLTMASLEIAELVESRHDNVKRAIERLAEKGIIRLPPLEVSENINNLGFKIRQEYYLFKGEQGKRDSIIVIAQLCPEFTARLVDRWQELENALFKLPKTLPEALRAYADECERNQVLTEKIQLDAPKVDFVDSYVVSTGSLGFRQVCKVLKVKETDFRLFLIENDIMYYLGRVLTPYQKHIDAKRFEVKVGNSAINSHAYSQAKFTPKGVQWIAGLLAASQL